jgi:hypothetical protein
MQPVDNVSSGYLSAAKPVKQGTCIYVLYFQMFNFKNRLNVFFSGAD